MTDVTLTLLADPAAPAGSAPVLVDADARAGHVLVTDLGVNRGDGIFEVAGCVEGRIHALDAHLARLARSATLMELPPPNLTHFEAAARRCVAALTARHPHAELLVKLVYTRGQEVGDPDGPTGWAMAYPSAPAYARSRRGIAVVTLDRGIASDAMRAAPWLLAGAKSLSYAINRAALREAHRRGVDDVLFLSSDGHVLEGPNSTVILRLGGVLVTPDPSEGVLPGTTQADLFAWAAEQGLRTETRPVFASELGDADAAWFTSSGRLCAPLTSLDGRPLAVDAAWTAAANTFLLARG